MKNSILIFTSLILCLGFLFVGCDSSAEKVIDARKGVKEAKNNVADAEFDLYVAKQDSTEEYKEFKRDAEDQIVKLEKKIAEIKLKISKEQKNQKSESMKLLTVLEQRIDMMKIELKDYQADKNNDWDLFRKDFNKNMDELGISISNFFTKPKK